jgi:hypothetical protein
MILEIVRADGQRTWHRIGAQPITLGRGFSNDLILDDPYVDARHARISCDDAGALQVEDLDSVNGVIAGEAGRLRRVVVWAGAEVRVGRTTLRFRDPNEDVAPALVDESPPAMADVSSDAPALEPLTAPVSRDTAVVLPDGRPGVARWMATTPARLLVVVATTAAFAVNTWLGNATRSSASEVFGAALGIVTIAMVWAGLWSVAGRVVVHRFHFTAHLAVVSAVILGVLVCASLEEWLSFAFPDVTAASIPPTALMFGLVAVLVAGHLAYSSTMTRRRRWLTGGAVAATLVAIVAAAALAKQDAFSDVPRFSGNLKPLPVAWLPTTSVADFGDAMRDVRHDVDELAAEQAKREPARGGTVTAAR